MGVMPDLSGTRLDLPALENAQDRPLADGRRHGERIARALALNGFQLHESVHSPEVFPARLAVDQLWRGLENRSIDRMGARLGGDAVEHERTAPGRRQQPRTAQRAELARDLVLRQAKDGHELTDTEIRGSTEEAEDPKARLIRKEPEKLRPVHGDLGGPGICDFAHANLGREAYARARHVSTVKS